MKILVADKISPKGVELLRKQPGFEVIEAYNSTPEKVLSLVKDVHAIAVRSETQITAEVIAAAPLLKVWAAPAWAWTMSTSRPPPRAAWW